MSSRLIPNDQIHICRIEEQKNVQGWQIVQIKPLIEPSASHSGSQSASHSGSQSEITKTGSHSGSQSASQSGSQISKNSDRQRGLRGIRPSFQEDLPTLLDQVQREYRSH